MSFDINKPYRTRDGREAKAILTPAGDLAGYIWTGSEVWLTRWHLDGRAGSSSGTFASDLVNIPEKRTVKVWFNVFEKALFTAFLSREAADSSYGAQCRIACIEREISYEVGEGL